MQTRFLAIVLLDPRAMDAQIDRLSAQLDRSVFGLGDRLIIWTTDSTSLQRFASGNSVAIGNLHRHPGRVDTNSASVDIETIQAPAELVSDFWGAYVTFGVNGNPGACSAFRSPSGALPCYYLATEDGWVFASDVDLLLDAGVYSPAIAWDDVIAQMTTAMAMRESTCLARIRELPPGCALHFVGGREPVRQQIWSFWDHVSVSTRSPAEEAEQLRYHIQSAVTAMASEHRTPAVSISGGLDSSIVLACLQQAGIAARPFTFVGSDPDADETAYARPLVRHLGTDLEEFRFDAADVDLQRSSAQHLPRPIGQTHAQTVAAKYRLLREQYGIDAVLTGMGGDSVFCTNFSALPLVDRFKFYGPRGDLVDTLRDLQQITGAPARAIAYQAAHIALRGRRAKRSSRVQDFFQSHLRASDMDPLAPDWLDPRGPMLPGKTYHVELLVGTFPGVEGFHRGTHPALLSPLLAQPVVECCLHIPSWSWSSLGRTRSIAREAFRPWLPDLIVDRRSKGGPDSFSRDVALAHKTSLREILLDGELARRGILDREAVEAALTERALLVQSRHSQLLHLADTEAWIAHWLRRAVAPSATPPR